MIVDFSAVFSPRVESNRERAGNGLLQGSPTESVLGAIAPPPARGREGWIRGQGA